MISELSRDNPRLIELTEAYAKLSLFEQSVWKQWADGIPIDKFRGEIGYMAQMWSMTPERYQNTYDYAVSLGLKDELVRLGEDGAFGAVTFERDGLKFGRDLLDSVFEIRFLEENYGPKSWGAAGPTVLDIGAGYGRFAHRLVQSFPFGCSVICVDAVPLSTFVCEFYLKFRGITEDAQVIPLHKLLEFSSKPQWPIHLATNMQSFSEMPLSAVEFWIKLCADLNIPHFFLEPHSADLIHPHYVTSEPGGANKNYYHLFEKYGYRLQAQTPKFLRELAPSLIYSTDFLLFGRG